jgi:hypothetical protein
MGQRVPKSFLIILAILLVLSAFGAYMLEEHQLTWLQAHPISVNLISGVVGFCAGFLTLAVVYNWFLDKDNIERVSRTALEEWDRFLESTLSLCEMMLDSYEEELQGNLPNPREIPPTDQLPSLVNSAEDFVLLSRLLPNRADEIDTYVRELIEKYYIPFTPNIWQPLKEFRAAAEEIDPHGTVITAEVVHFADRLTALDEAVGDRIKECVPNAYRQHKRKLRI